MLDFTEIAGNGRGLEQLVRELLLQVGYDPHWSGEGPDGGRDLTFSEHGDAVLGRKPRRWLVSCKDNAQSGRAVGQDASDGLMETLAQHGAQGFLLVCTTHPSAGLVTRLEAVESQRRGEIAAHIWDGATLERMLGTPRGWAVAQQFMPASAGAAGWRVFATEAPNRWLVAHRGYYFHLSARTAGGTNYDFESLDARLDEIEAAGTRLGVRLRLRAVWHNDTHGAGYVWYLDSFTPSRGQGPDPAAVRTLLRSGISREDGQFHEFEVTYRAFSPSDHFDYDHYSYYEDLPSYI